MTYGELKSLVTTYLKRSDLQDLYDQFRDLAEQLIAKSAKLTYMEVELEIPSGSYDDGALLPTGWGSYKSVRAGSSDGTLFPLSVLTRQQFDALQGESGYTLDGGKIYIGGQSGDIQTTYYKRPGDLDTEGSTNSVLDNESALYLYGMLIYAADSLQDDALLKTWTTRFDNEIQAANNATAGARLSGSAPQIQGN